MSGQPTTSQEITSQAQIMAQTSKPTSHPKVTSFSRFVATVKGPKISQGCPHLTKNGHITPDAATRCGQELASAILASQTTPEASQKLAPKLELVINTIDRFKCSQGCKFGHKTLASAITCSVGSQASQTKTIKANLKVTVAGALPKPTSQPKPKPTSQPKTSLKASAGGVGRAGSLSGQPTSQEATSQPTEASQGQPEASQPTSQGQPT